MIKYTHKLSPALLLCLSLAAGLANAQPGASVTGTVKDPQGQPVAGAALTLFSRTGAAGSATTSDSSGSYRFDGLPAGDYLLRAAAPGFALFLVEDIHLSTGAEEKRDVALQVAGVQRASGGHRIRYAATSRARLQSHYRNRPGRSRCARCLGALRCRGSGARRARSTTRRARSLHHHPNPRAAHSGYCTCWWTA